MNWTPTKFNVDVSEDDDAILIHITNDRFDLRFSCVPSEVRELREQVDEALRELAARSMRREQDKRARREHKPGAM